MGICKGELAWRACADRGGSHLGCQPSVKQRLFRGGHDRVCKKTGGEFVFETGRQAGDQGRRAHWRKTLCLASPPTVCGAPSGSRQPSQFGKHDGYR